MSRGKALTQRATTLAMRRRSGGLTSLGHGLARAAEYLQFVARDAHREARFGAAAPVPPGGACPEDVLVYDVGANNGLGWKDVHAAWRPMASSHFEDSN